MNSPIGPVQAGFPCCAFPCGSHLSSGVAVTLILIVGPPHEPYLENAAWFHYFHIFCTRTEQVTGLKLWPFLLWTLDIPGQSRYHHVYLSWVIYAHSMPTTITYKTQNAWSVNFGNGGATEKNPNPKILAPTQNTLWHVLLGSAEPILTSFNGSKPLSTTTKDWTFNHLKCL